MQHFKYTAVDRKGAQISAAELADSESELIHRLRGKGLSPIRIELDSGGTKSAISSEIRNADLVDILRGLPLIFRSTGLWGCWHRPQTVSRWCSW